MIIFTDSTPPSLLAGVMVTTRSPCPLCLGGKLTQLFSMPFWGEEKPKAGESKKEREREREAGREGNRPDYPNTVIKGEMCFSNCQDD